jgi:hypothetical protein
MVSEIARNSRLIVAVRPEMDRACPSRAIVAEAHRRLAKAIDGKNVADGLRVALGEIRKGEPLLVLGSHYVVGELMTAMNVWNG